MFCVIYSFQIKEGKKETFIRGWKKLTELIYQYENSLGSRLHYAGESLYIAYAQWPDKATWERSGNNLPEKAEQYRKQMRESCSDIKTEYQLESVEDLVMTKQFSEKH